MNTWLARLRRNWKSHLSTLLVLVVAMAVVQAWQTRNVPKGPAPDFSAVLLSGPGAQVPSGVATPVTLAQWRAAHPGQAVALNIWSEWCPYCKAEEGSITSLSADWPVLTLATRSGPEAKMNQVLQQRKLPWVAALDTSGAIAERYGFTGVPAFVVIDADGQIRGTTGGYTTEWGMRARLWWAQWF
jgi:thiol-disulfide isomerase/thioredoxin